MLARTTRLLLSLLLVGGFLLAGALPLAAPARAASYPTLSASLSGPSILPVNGTGTYLLTGTGGPAMGFNGTQVGIFSYNATVGGPNTTNVIITPVSGVLTNGATHLSLKATIAETLVIAVELKSSFAKQNATTNVTYSVTVLAPYVVKATIVDSQPYSTLPFNLTVLLDGVPVGSIGVPSILAHGSYTATFQYAVASLAVGWHTFSMNLASEHGLLAFAGGSESFGQSFYVTGPPVDDSGFILLGILWFVLAVFIWVAWVGARRRKRKR
jgi:hypothetical protein